MNLGIIWMKTAQTLFGGNIIYNSSKNLQIYDLKNITPFPSWNIDHHQKANRVEIVLNKSSK